jgi:F0F1-type ATP synthase membrane subunit b/b'
MARRPGSRAVDTKIKRTEEKAKRLKKEYDDTLAVLKGLLEEKRKIQAEILLQAINKSGKSFEEVLKIIEL